MIQIELKAKHFYFIVSQLRNYSIQQYFSLVSKMKTVLAGNTDLEALFTVSASTDEVVAIFRILTQLPEGIANVINVEMDDLLAPQIVAGVTTEQAGGIGPDADGNLPYDAYWQRLARDISVIKTENANARNSYISEGKSLIDTI
jgi:hypothetical protein